MKKYDYLIVGAGLFGSVFAHEAKKRGKNCLVIDKREHIGGNIYCQETEGINVHLTIDRPQEGWDGHVGFVPSYVKSADWFHTLLHSGLV